MINSQKKKVVAVIQARMGSSRLPRKSLMPLAKKPLVDHVMERLLKAQRIDAIVMAIPQTPDDDAIATRAQHLGVAVYRGSENDLVDRFYHAAKQYSADIVVRVCADNPLIHPTEVDRCIDYFLSNDFDFVSNVTNVMGNNYPDGLGAEVFRFSALKWIYENIHDSYGREHVHSNFYNHQDKFRLGTVTCPIEFAYPEIVLDINTPQEYAFISKLFADLQSGDNLITIQQIIPWYRRHQHMIPQTYKH